jgi:hypothetical protein
MCAQEIPNVHFDTLPKTIEKVNKNRLKIIKSRSKENHVFAIGIIQDEFMKKDSDHKYTYKVKVNEKGTTMLASDYKLTSTEVVIGNEKSENEVFLEIKSDNLTDRERRIILYVDIVKDSKPIDLSKTEMFYELEVVVKSIEKPLDGYEYLAYVGTNFDLVEGIQAKDLFFAGNVLSKPNRFKKGNVGFYLSLYGNRAFTQVDSTGLIRQNNVYEQLSDTTYLKKINNDTYLSNRVTDNIGVYISPLIQLKWLRTKDPNNNLLLYYSPSLEFVYRRTTLTSKKLNSRTVEMETIDGNFNQVAFLNDEFPSFTEIFNEYSFNAGIVALYMCLENEKISVRVHASTGYTSNYYREFEPNGSGSRTEQKSDIFFSGRAWITEPNTGVTLQVEVTNNFFNPRPFFVATLSKAFNFSQLGSIFKPVVKN